MADLFAYFGDPATKETEYFIKMFDKWFDCLNLRSLDQWIHKCKPNLKPYTSVDDPRFQVYTLNISSAQKCVIFFMSMQLLQDDFLGYLDQWESGTKDRVDLSASDKRKLLLSSETVEGL